MGFPPDTKEETGDLVDIVATGLGAEEAGGNYMCRTNGVLTASRHECSHSVIDSFSAIISDLHSRLGT